MSVKKFVYEKPGGTEVIKVVEDKEPKAEQGKVIVRPLFGSVNHVDIWGRMDLPGQPFPRVFGSDVAGVVEDPSDTPLKKGEKVVLYPMDFCSTCDNCLKGYENSCFYRKIYGVHEDGFFSTLVSVPYRNVLKLPDNVSLEYAAALPVAYTTAYHALIDRANLRPSQKVLVLGASGGAGLAAIQIAKSVGAYVVGTTSFDWKGEILRKAGADEILKPDEKLEEEVQKLTNGLGFDVVFDSLGGAYTARALNLVKRGGKIVNMAMTTGASVNFNLRALYANNIDLIGVYLGTRRDLLELLNLVSYSRLKPIIDSVYPIEEVAKAQEKMERRSHVGKILLKF